MGRGVLTGLAWGLLLVGLAGCHAAEDDAAGLAKELDDPVRRENAIFHLQKLYTTALANHDGDRAHAEVKGVADEVVKPLSDAYIAYPEDRLNGRGILGLLQEMQDPRGLPALVAALNWRTEVSEEHAITAAQTIQTLDVPAADVGNTIDALSKSLEKITDDRAADNKMRIAMIQALGSMKDKRATPVLDRLATKQDEKQNFLINRLAAQQLGELGDPAAIPSLIRCLYLYAPNRPDLRMNDVAAEALVRTGRPSLKPLLKVLDGDDAAANAIAKQYIATLRRQRPDLAQTMTVRQVTGAEAAFALGALGFPDAFEPLVQEAKSSDHVRKINAAIALVRLDVPSSSEDRVRSALKDAYKAMPSGFAGVRLRGQLLAAMAHTYDDGLLPFILSELTDRRNNPELRLIAAQNYALLANKEDATLLRKAIASEPKSEAGGFREKFEEHESLLKLADECNKDLGCWTKRAKSADDTDARKAVYMLGRYGQGNAQALSALVEQLGNPQLGVRLGALMAVDHVATKGSKAAVAKIDELKRVEEGRAVWTQFRAEALPIQARLRSRAGG